LPPGEVSEPCPQRAHRNLADAGTAPVWMQGMDPRLDKRRAAWVVRHASQEAERAAVSASARGAWCSHGSAPTMTGRPLSRTSPTRTAALPRTRDSWQRGDRLPGQIG